MDDHPNWVKGRANCNLPTVFAVLCEIVQRDVQEFNALPSKDRRERLFRCKNMECKQDGGTYPTLRVEDGDGQGVDFALSRAAIAVSGRFYIKPEWHFQTRTCRFRVDDGKTFLELWQVSQQGLGSLFFD